MTFKPYMHVERFGNDAVDGIELGAVSVFPKLDGTNASAWCHEGELRFGSRHRELSRERDNAGFMSAMLEPESREKLDAFFGQHPGLRLYGEWLVPHTLQTYRDDAWRRFWIFDVLNDATDEHLSYERYQPLLDGCGLDYVPPLAHLKNGDYESFIHVLQQNTFFIVDGKGTGEGIVLKNYDYYNKFGRQVWAKLVTSEFKEKHYRTMGAPEHESILVEEAIATEAISSALVEKTVAKIRTDEGEWSSRHIPRLLDTVYHDVVTEELWSELKRHRNPTINFKTLKHFCVGRVKQVAPQYF